MSLHHPMVPPLPGGCECGWERGSGGEGPYFFLMFLKKSAIEPKPAPPLVPEVRL